MNAFPAQGDWFNERRWDRATASIRDGRGPERVEVGEVDPKFKPRPVGFTASLPEPEPLTWEGDNA